MPGHFEVCVVRRLACTVAQVGPFFLVSDSFFILRLFSSEVDHKRMDVLHGLGYKLAIGGTIPVAHQPVDDGCIPQLNHDQMARSRVGE